MEPIITKPVTLDIKELIKLSRLLSITAWNITFIGLVIILLISYLYMAINIGNFILLFYGVAFIILLIMMFHNRLSKYFTDPRNKSIFSERVFIFDEQKLTIKADNGTTSELLYSEFVDFMYKRRLYILYKDSSSSYIIPETAFQSEEDLQRFKELFNFKD